MFFISFCIIAHIDDFLWYSFLQCYAVPAIYQGMDT